MTDTTCSQKVAWPKDIKINASSWHEKLSPELTVIEFMWEKVEIPLMAELPKARLSWTLRHQNTLLKSFLKVYTDFQNWF